VKVVVDGVGEDVPDIPDLYPVGDAEGGEAGSVD
jgi:hypothetical protein